MYRKDTIDFTFANHDVKMTERTNVFTKKVKETKTINVTKYLCLWDFMLKKGYIHFFKLPIKIKNVTSFIPTKQSFAYKIYKSH